MDVKEVEKHHLLFYISTVLCIFAVKLIFFDYFGLNYIEEDVSIIKGIFYLLVIYFFVLIIVKAILFIIYYNMSKYFIDKKYKANNYLGTGDFYLATASIITAFFIDDFLKIIENPIIVFLLIGFLFYIIYWLNQKIKIGSF
jgi:hypothetical protein